MDMIERYIYEVTRRVPQETRDEIRLELQGLIDDMCAAEGCSVEEALQKLGSPAEFAKRYRGDSNYLIGPEYYDTYIWLLKIALFGIGVSAIISAIAQGIIDVESWTGFFTNFFSELFTTFINGTLSMVGVVTIIFAILERQKVKIDIKPEEKWSVDELAKNTASVKSWTPSSLPPIPDTSAQPVPDVPVENRGCPPRNPVPAQMLRTWIQNGDSRTGGRGQTHVVRQAAVPMRHRDRGRMRYRYHMP